MELVKTTARSSARDPAATKIKSGLFLTTSIEDNLKDITIQIPDLNDLITEIHNTAGSSSCLNTFSLEKLLWPLKIKDAEIPCYIVPIKPYYARELFDTKAAKAELFGVQPSLIWSKENVYYKNVHPNVEKFPARILWYASVKIQ